MDTDGKKLAVFRVCADWGSKPAMPRRIARTQPTTRPSPRERFAPQPATNHSGILLLVFKCPVSRLPEMC